MEVPKCVQKFDQLTDFKPLEELIAKLVSEKKTFFFYAASNHDANGKSWCDDCDNSKPFIEEGLKLFGSQDTVPFIYCSVDRDTWRNQSNFYRTYKSLNLKCVPTLVYFDKGVEMGRLVESELIIKDAVNDFFTSPKY